MGGIGSGRNWYFGAKTTTADSRAIDVRRWQKQGILSPGHYFNHHWEVNGKPAGAISVQTEFDRVILTYRHQSPGKDWQQRHYPVFLDWTPCHLGGKRTWFLCPEVGCGRRVAILYAGRVFACRHCHKLVYQSQREEEHDRAARKADKIREKLGWQPGILNGRGWLKPKGMHWNTYQKLTEEHDRLVRQALAGFSLKLGLPMREFDR